MQGTGRGGATPGCIFSNIAEITVYLDWQRQWRREGQGKAALRLWKRKKREGD